jgi:hypothetical protein
MSGELSQPTSGSKLCNRHGEYEYGGYQVVTTETKAEYQEKEMYEEKRKKELVVVLVFPTVVYHKTTSGIVDRGRPSPAESRTWWGTS